MGKDMSDLRNNGFSLNQWLKDHSYAIIVAVVLIVGDYFVINYRMNAFDEQLKKLEIKVEENRIEIEEIQIQQAKDITEIKTLLLQLDRSVNGLLDQQRQRDKDIQKFYEKYGAILNGVNDE
jgi:hypothetical protein